MTVTWTDDLRVCITHNKTLAALVDYVIASEQAPWEERLEVLTTRFALSFDDARLAIDRVDGGRVRAANPAHEPDHSKDPIAWIAYRRLRGEAVPAEVSAPSAEEERAATAQWRAALEGEDADATTSVWIALRLVELAAQTMADEPDRSCRGRVVLRAAHALSDAAEACIEAQDGCATEGTQAWADAVRMGIGARQLATWFAGLGAGDLEGIALNLQGRIVTRLLGQCHAHVGRVMLDGIDWSLRTGDTATAIGSCQAVVGDFAALVDEWEADEDAPFDEHRQALGHLLAALEVLASLDQAVDGELRARCLAQLARPPTR
jgi:hypothetical protein